MQYVSQYKRVLELILQNFKFILFGVYLNRRFGEQECRVTKAKFERMNFKSKRILLTPVTLLSETHRQKFKIKIVIIRG